MTFFCGATSISDGIMLDIVSQKKTLNMRRANHNDKRKPFTFIFSLFWRSIWLLFVWEQNFRVEYLLKIFVWRIFSACNVALLLWTEQSFRSAKVHTWTQNYNDGFQGGWIKWHKRPWPSCFYSGFCSNRILSVCQSVTGVTTLLMI